MSGFGEVNRALNAIDAPTQLALLPLIVPNSAQKAAGGLGAHGLSASAALWSQIRRMAQMPGGKALVGARHRQDGVLVAGSPHELDARWQAFVRKAVRDSDSR